MWRALVFWNCYGTILLKVVESRRVKTESSKGPRDDEYLSFILESETGMKTFSIVDIIDIATFMSCSLYVVGTYRRFALAPTARPCCQSCGLCPP